MKTVKNKRKKHVALKIFLGIVFILVVACIAVYVWQKDNIESAVVGLKYSKEDIAEKMTESKASTEQSLKKYNLPITRDFTVEEEEKIRKGEMTVEEAMANIKAEAVQNGTADNSTEPGNNVSAVAQTEEEEIIGRYVTDIYSLKAFYIGQLGSVEKMLKSEYNATGKDKSKISSIVSSHLGEISAMESECDNKIDTLLAGLKNELVAINADTSIVDTIEEAYVNEKSLRKSYYLSQYK